MLMQQQQNIFATWDDTQEKLCGSWAKQYPIDITFSIERNCSLVLFKEL